VLPSEAPDLVIRRLSIDPPTAQNGQTVVVRARVTNTGNRTSSASVTTFRINQSKTDVATTDDVLCAGRPTPVLAPGATARVRCTATLHDRPIGENIVWAIADTTATSGQFNTTNDRRRTTLNVTATCTDTGAAPGMTWPIDQPRIVQDYASFGSVPLGRGKLGYHSGVDLVSHLDTPAEQLPVYAAADGEVVAVRKACPSPAEATVDSPNGLCAGGWGNFVLIRHGDGIFSIYAHLGDVSAELGCIGAGEPIGIVGSSGSTKIPPHLHFDVMADLTELTRTAFGLEYYRTSHPAVGRVPETDDGKPTTHLDPRDFMTRTRIRLVQNAVASRADVTGGDSVYFARGQELLSYGELVPGYYLVDVPSAVLPEDGPAYADDVRYAWLPAAKVTVVETDVAADAEDVARVDGVALFEDGGVGAGFAALHAKASSDSAEVSLAWGGQQYAEAGEPVVESSSGIVWQPVFIGGTASTGPAKPRIAWIDSQQLGPPLH
jgi:murein DD-endopeptidase MepM/ murein hydrolase activator NlpD